MTLDLERTVAKPRLKALLDHFATIDDPREPWRAAHPLPEVLLLVVCGTICDCDDYDAIADWNYGDGMDAPAGLVMGHTGRCRSFQ